MDDDGDEHWRRHLLLSRPLIIANVCLYAALLCFLPIPSEASALDQAISGGGLRPLAVVLAAAPVVLAIGWPLLCVGRLAVPMPLQQAAPRAPRWKPAALLMAGSALGSLASVLQLRMCISAGSLCRAGAFGLSRNPVRAPCVAAIPTIPSAVILVLSSSSYPTAQIALCAVLTATLMVYLIPSTPNAVGTVWLAAHFDRTVRVEEDRLATRFGAAVWHEYCESGVHRWLSPSGVALVGLAAFACWSWERQAAAARRPRDALLSTADDGGADAAG